MGFKGKARPGAGGRPTGGFGGLGALAGRLGGGGAPGGMAPGRYSVSPNGTITRLPRKHKKGARLPKFVYDMMRENIELSKDVRRVVLLQAVHPGGKA